MIKMLNIILPVGRRRRRHHHHLLLHHDDCHACCGVSCLTLGIWNDCDNDLLPYLHLYHHPCHLCHVYHDVIFYLCLHHMNENALLDAYVQEIYYVHYPYGDGNS